MRVAGIRQRNLVRDESDDEQDVSEVEEETESGEEEGGIIKQNMQGQNLSSRDFYLWDEPLSSMQVTVASFENNPNVRNHIIVCGIHSSIKNFIIPLRAKYLCEF